MKFTIERNIREHNEIDLLKGWMTGLSKFIVLIILIPFIIIGWLIEKFETEEKPKMKESRWREFRSSEKIQLFRGYIDDEHIEENDLSYVIDIPEEPDDIHLFEVKSKPQIIQLRGKYFDLNDIETDNGFYLISWNEVGQGMTLWFIDKKTIELKKVTDLEPKHWNLRAIDGKIKLTAKGKQKDYKIEIKEEV